MAGSRGGRADLVHTGRHTHPPPAGSFLLPAVTAAEDNSSQETSQVFCFNSEGPRETVAAQLRGQEEAVLFFAPEVVI